ncbi:hypothetical protein TP48_02285 [Xanthomonas citri pv. citri]|nr:hypothetical protein AB890_07690 [Xanthomonas citri pv. citri]OOW56750.1 hypothetical protein BFQ41_04325 [Xanthomonas citri pv. citri]PWF01779.1 hypothetical protein TP44_03355 [Xanthomonas citri pv. citri]PWF02296.1 hypothetical protein TP48_02285 [Xanthomonas citri pv. citri]PWF05438.1 hypothetical protein TP39_15415 [Xanthomonas citri pv. citri]
MRCFADQIFAGQRIKKCSQTVSMLFFCAHPKLGVTAFFGFLQNVSRSQSCKFCLFTRVAGVVLDGFQEAPHIIGLVVFHRLVAYQCNEQSEAVFGVEDVGRTSTDSFHLTNMDGCAFRK